MTLTSEEWKLLQDVLGATINVYKSKAAEDWRAYDQKCNDGDFRSACTYAMLARASEKTSAKVNDLFNKLFYGEDTNL